MRSFGLLAIGFLAGLVLFWVGVQIDLFFNPFLREIRPEWWNMFTSHHGLTIAYLYYPAIYWIFSVVGGGLVGLVVWARVSE